MASSGSVFTIPAWLGFVVAPVGLTLGLATGAARAADPVIIDQNGFESGDTCAWTSTSLPVSCDPLMVHVPAGSFTIGSNTGPSDEQPAHTVSLSAYWIDRNDVTVAQYAACVAASACAAPNGTVSDFTYCNWGSARSADNPINCVDWNRGQAYCAWLGERYPTEAEWEKAARGAGAPTYPWGEETPTCDYAVIYDFFQGGYGCGLNSTWPVGSKGAGQSPYGALDMAGNVWNWVSDWYSASYYPSSPTQDPQGPVSGTYKVLSGSSYVNSGAATLHSSLRQYGGPTTWYGNGGFRCAHDG